MSYNFDIDSVASPSNTLNGTTENYNHNYDSNYNSAITPGWEYAWCPDDATGSIDPTGWEYDLYNNVLNNVDKQMLIQLVNENVIRFHLKNTLDTYTFNFLRTNF